MDNFFKILLIEDDDALRFIIKDNLLEKNYEVDEANDGEKALQLYYKGNYSLIILDVMLPNKDGFTVAKEIREKDDAIPIIFLTAKSMTEDKILGLTIGGDDYITKPFNMEELLLKVKIFLKRSQVNQENGEKEIPDNLKLGNYIFSYYDLTLKNDKRIQRLTAKEAEIIKLFALNINKILNREEILLRIWGANDYFLGRSLDVFISRLRKYFNDDPNIRIKNIHGLGFRFSIKNYS